MNFKFTLVIFGLLFLFTTTYSQSYTVSGTANGSNEVPPVSTNASATFSGTYDSVTDMINITVTYSGLSSGLVAAHLHAGAAGTNGPVIVNFSPSTGATSGTISGTYTIPSANEAALIAGNVYVNLHTSNNTGGEIRGQAILTPISIERQIIINEIDITNGWVELHNVSDVTLDVSQLRLCKFPSYPIINTLPVLNGSTTIAPGGYVVISWPAEINSTNAELGLYKASGGFANSANIIDYVKYRSASPVGRANVAVAAGVWDNASKFVPLPTTTARTLQNFNLMAMGGNDTNSNHWWDAPATQGLINACISSYTMMNANRINGTESGNADYETNGALESIQLITSSAIVDYDSALFIELLEDFEVELGAEFLAFIDGCNQGMGGLHN